MEQYTTECTNPLYDFYYDEDESEKFKEKLEEIMKNFRDFDKALDDFLIKHGYVGEIENINDKIKYIQNKFDSASVDRIDPRVLKNWFSIGNRPKTEKHFALFKVDRENLFRFCFAFQLSVDECNDFFRKICLQRSFDCHNMKETVYYYAISNKLNYLEAKALINRLPKEHKNKEILDLDCNDILFTDTIIIEIGRFKNADELIQFCNNNHDRFNYNNVRAYKVIKDVWDVIDKVDGLADKEGYPQKKHSVWRIYLWILGLPKTSKLIPGSDRSVSAFLKDNKLLHHLVADSFPGRQELEAIINGKHKSYEVVRKTLVILLFYKFWVNKTLKYKDEEYKAKKRDYDRYIATINDSLNDVGYPMLYVGNPFDWIFIWVAFQENPLYVFREIIFASYEVKEAELEPKV